MKKYLKLILFAATAILTFTQCDEDTAGIGSSIVPESDIVTIATDTFTAKSKSIDVANSILNNSETLYLGRYTEPENNTTFEASFATQFNSGYGAAFPEDGVKDKKAAYTNLRIYYNSYKGKENNTMKCAVYELENTMSEGEQYYTDFAIEDYTGSGKAPIATKVYSAKDYSLHDTISADEYPMNIEIALPNEIGNRIITEYYENPDNFKNSEVFINNVFKGLYVKSTQGDGTILNIYRASLEVAFSHYITSSTGLKDSIETLVTPFHSGKEVIQLNKFDNGDTSEMLAEEDYTYIKTPAGIFTEVELPVDEIMDRFPGDTINSVKIEFSSFGADEENGFTAPQEVIMVRKSEQETFFSKNKLCNGKTSFRTTLSNSGKYTFSNIANLIKECRKEREAGTNDADWNKVVIIPVSTSSDVYGNVTRVRHYTPMSCVKLRGGKNHGIDVVVVASNYK